jgi:hypothetical protein
MLWRDYGIPFSDMGVYDIILALNLNGAENDRQNNAASQREIEARKAREDG